MYLVFCNCPPDAAVEIARALVEERMAACVNVLPEVRSIYRWDGRICDDRENTLLIKVAADRVDALRARLAVLHPYDVPEIIALPVDVARSFAPYVDWVRNA